MPTRLDPPRTRELDTLINKLVGEITDLLKDIFGAVHAGERPVASVKGVLDAVSDIRSFAEANIATKRRRKESA